MGRKLLTRDDVLERLKEVWEVVGLEQDELPQELVELLDYNLNVAKLFVELQGCKNFTKVHAIGFGAGDDEEDEADEEGDE